MCIRDRYMGKKLKFIQMSKTIIIFAALLSISTVYSQVLGTDFLVGLHQGTGCGEANADIIKAIDKRRYSVQTLTKCFTSFTSTNPEQQLVGFQCLKKFFNSVDNEYSTLINQDPAFRKLMNILTQVFLDAQNFQDRMNVLNRNTGRNAWVEMVQIYEQQFKTSNFKFIGFYLGRIIMDLYKTQNTLLFLE
eukprot:TRINITY_DN3625_c0_g1_i3.p2 TRINITY_DN3625_c0_g1~~TRINITY_DN3625_c0_g1_i3.p2  ORF type:complete len:191 (+),score=44.90 TRINITY_DN3625_c0_g1_i3:66-638(+)